MKLSVSPLSSSVSLPPLDSTQYTAKYVGRSQCITSHTNVVSVRERILDS